MVPRAVAVMASYDAERRYVRDRARAGRYTARLLPVRRDAYSLFALMAPSRTLAEAGDPLRYAKTNARGLLRAIEEELRPKIAELTRNAPTEGTPQEIWYAAAPLLLDRESRVSTAEWLRGPSSVVQTSGGGEYRVWEDLATHVTDGLIDPAALGRPPGNLSEVMAALAAGSPANATLRALSCITSPSTGDAELKAQAMTAAWAFRHLFRVPTSEGLLKYLYKPGIPGVRAYWRRVLAYALEGGLSAVLEEYFHVIREDRGGKTDATALVQTLCQALQLAAGTLDVTQWERERNGVRRETFAMRQHFARRYANDGVSGSDQQASQHLDAVRAAFNSPFWPFVLGTTSIGQEGARLSLVLPRRGALESPPRIQLTSNSARAVSTAITVTPYDFQQTASAHYCALVHPSTRSDLQNHLAFRDLQITGGSQGLQHLRYRRPCRRRVRGVPVVHRHAQNFVFHGKPRDPNTRNSLLNFFQEAIRDLHHVFLLFSSGLPLFQPVISDIRHTLQANHLP